MVGIPAIYSDLGDGLLLLYPHYGAYVYIWMDCIVAEPTQQ